MPSGTVKWFNTERGFGFIGPDGGAAARTGLSISLQCSGAGMDRLREGANVTFDIVNIPHRPALRLRCLRQAWRRGPAGFWACTITEKMDST
jgi:CspA family cold shock protein